MRIYTVLFLIALGCTTIVAQTTGPTSTNDAGYDVHNVYVGDHESINPSSGNLSLSIPLVHFNGRAGNDLNYALTYNADFWYLRSVPGYNGQTLTYILEDNSQVSYGMGWHLSSPNIQYLAQMPLPGYPVYPQNGAVKCDTDYTVVMPDNRKVFFDSSLLRRNCYSAYSGVWNRDTSYDTTAPQTIGDVTLDAVSGVATIVPSGAKISAMTVTDRNGNQISYTSGGVTDTLGRSISVQYPDENSSNHLATVTVTTGTVDSSSLSLSSFPCAPSTSGVSYMGQSNPTVITSVQYPDGSKYSFWYNEYAELTAIQYPTGGYTRYSYGTVCGTQNNKPYSYLTGNPLGRAILKKFVCRDYHAVFASAPTSTSCPTSGEDETDYSYTWDGVGTTTVTIDEYDHGTDKVSTFLQEALTGQTETCHFAVTDKIASKVLKTVDRTGPSYFRASIAPITYCSMGYSSQKITLDDGVTYSTKTLTYNDLNSWVAPDDVKEYAWFVPGSNDPNYNGSLIRETKTTFWANSIGVRDAPTDVQVFDKNGTLTSETSYSYDEYSTYPLTNRPGASQHDDTNYSNSNTVRGNVTTISRYLLPPNVGTKTAVSSHKKYDTLGNVISQQDPNGNWTDTDYTDNFGTSPLCPPAKPTYAYPTMITLPANAASFRAKQYMTYFSCSGMMQSKKDENDVNAARQGTTYTWDPMHRSLYTNFPDTGQTSTTYPDPNTITKTSLATPDPSVTSTALLDGLGRTWQTQSSSGSGTVYAETTFDGLGRVKTKTNPHFSTLWETDGTVTYGDPNNPSAQGYDALDRVLLITEQDGSQVSTLYNTNCLTVTDEAGNKRKSCADAAERLTQVFEDPSGANYETDYQYDVLNNLLRVDQKGNAPSDSSQWRTRTFAYDALSRLVCAANPEVGSTGFTCPTPDAGAYTNGTIRYTYDNNGNALTKVAPAPNQTGTTTVTTTYSYDNLNRITGQTFSDSTYRGSYFYDETTSGFSHSVANGIGHLTTSWEAYGGKDYSYDSMGRVTLVKEDVNSSVVSKWYNTQYLYNLLGSTHQIQYPSARQVTYTYDAGSHALTAQDSNGTQYGSSMTYHPNGAPYQWYVPNLDSKTDLNSRLQISHLFSDNNVVNPTTNLSKSYDYHTGHDNGNVYTITNEKDNNRTQSFTYDHLNRIWTAASQANTGQWSWGNNYSIDPWGNMQSAQMSGKADGDNIVPAGDVHNRAATMSYDAAGNLLNDGTSTYTYDAGNMLKTGGGYSYLYDSSGMRFQKLVNGVGVKGYWYGAGSEPLAEATGYGLITAEYIYLNGQRVARVDTAPNLLSWSEQFDNAVWIKQNSAIVTANYTTDPLGGTTADRLQIPYNQLSRVLQQASGLANQTVTFSLYMKSNTGSNQTVTIFLREQNFGTVYGTTYCTVTTAWQRCSVTAAIPAASTGVYALIYNVYDTHNWDVSAWGAQLEFGSTMGTYVATTSTVPNVAHFYLSDQVKSLSMVINAATGVVEEDCDFRPYGKVVPSANCPVEPNHYMFSGKQRDSETGLDYFGARYFNGPMGRWSSADWAEKPANIPYADFADPQSLNLYAYLRNNPLSAVDVDGHATDPCKGQTDSRCSASTTTSILEGKNQVSVVQTTEVTQKNDDGTTTKTKIVDWVTVSTKKGEEGKFKSATETTSSVTTDQKGNVVGQTERSTTTMNFSQSVQAIGANTYAATVDVAVGGSPGVQYGRWAAKHPVQFTLDAAAIGSGVGGTAVATKLGDVGKALKPYAIAQLKRLLDNN